MVAAGELFAVRGPASVSVRDVASLARVNHGLVHRHFGSKEQLVRAVMRSLADELSANSARAGEGLPTAFFDSASGSPYWRVLARALLEGTPVSELQDGFPMVGQLAVAMREARRAGLLRDDVDEHLLVGMTVALHLGWLVFEPFIASAVKTRRGSGERRDVTLAWLRLLQGAAPLREAPVRAASAPNRARRVARPR